MLYKELWAVLTDVCNRLITEVFVSFSVLLIRIILRSALQQPTGNQYVH